MTQVRKPGVDSTGLLDNDAAADDPRLLAVVASHQTLHRRPQVD